jgi:16S rRNA G966 N2-methylase RsmD
MFFDRFPQFAETSSTASRPARLNIRHHGMFEANQPIFQGAKVLDLASHDGRWSMAALDAGASHVTGVEGRPELVKEAESTFSLYGVDASRYRFINDDMFDVLRDPVANGIDVDVVMCLGFIYHTLRYQDLFAGIRALKPKYFLIDTAVIKHDKAMVLVHSEDSSKESAGLDHTFQVGGRLITGRPSPSALELMLDVHGFTVTSRFDWATYLAENHPNNKTVASYRDGKRVTWLCELSDSIEALPA